VGELAIGGGTPLTARSTISSGLAGPACSIALLHDGEAVVGAIGDLSSTLAFRARKGGA
jgi:hypothetical protein